MITLSIIGVVAALTIPQLVKNMNDYAFGKSRDITLAKITEATNQMKSNDVLLGYSTNDSFVTEFQKYMKVTKTCDSTTLTNCFPAKFKTGSNQDVDTPTLTTGTKLGTNNITGNTIALMLANGTSILFTLRDSTKVAGACDRIDPTDNQAITTGCMSFLYDINGFGSPNIIGKDIGAVNVDVAGFSCPGTLIGSLCVGASDVVYSSINTCSDTTYDSYLATNASCANNQWAGAKKVCMAQGMNLPTIAQLSAMYAVKATIPGINLTGSYFSNEDYLPGMVKQVDFSNGSIIGDPKMGVYPVRCVK